MTRRLIRFHDGERNTSFTVTECAALRAANLSNPEDRERFMTRFALTRDVVPDIPEIDPIWRLRTTDAVSEAATIEALASLRAEGKIT